MISFPRAAALLSVPILAMLATPAVAHVVHGEAGGLLAGLSHPIIGIDHLLALLAMGLWSGSLLQGQWLAILATVGIVLLISAVGGVTGFTLPYMETGIGLSVLVLGLMLSAAFRHFAPGISLIVLFTLFHGNAHGVEAPAEVHLLGYFAGFTLSSLALLAVGQWVGRGIREKPVLRVAGGGIALAGLWFVFG